MKYVLQNYLDENKKYSFWEWIGKNRSIGYGWTALDIFLSNYNAIRLYEYGYSYKQKDVTYYVNNPKNKIVKYKKI